MSQPSIITKRPSGGYEVTTKVNDNPYSALVYTPRSAITLWGAHRLARKHQRRHAKSIEAAKLREVVE